MTTEFYFKREEDIDDAEDSRAVLHDGQTCEIVKGDPDGWEFGPLVRFPDGAELLVKKEEVFRAN